MVVFSKNQILPRYIIYYRQCAPVSMPAVIVPSGSRPQHVLWVDDNLHGETKSTITVLRNRMPNICHVHVTSTHELVVWLSTHENLLANRHREVLRVVTCRYRERDGGAQAAEKLIDTLRSDAKTRHLKVLLYCGNRKDVAILDDKKQYEFFLSAPF